MTGALFLRRVHRLDSLRKHTHTHINTHNARNVYQIHMGEPKSAITDAGSATNACCNVMSWRGAHGSRGH